MPEFRLEVDHVKVCKREPSIFYTKGAYQPTVKITDWTNYSESLPLDNNPYCPGSLNFFLSHYNNLSSLPNEPFTTTTQAAMEQVNDVKLKDAVERLHYIPNKFMVNYYSYKDTTSCDTNVKSTLCPPVCAESYQTTMQRSYPPPQPCAMQRFSFPKMPWMQYRRFRWVQSPEMSEDTFYDETYIKQVQQIQQSKGFLTKSYDPCTFMNTDGTLPPGRKLKVFELPYEQE